MRWFWLALGLFVGGVGVPVLLAPPLHFHPITGKLASDSGADMAVRLVGDTTTYVFESNFTFTPPLPAHLPSGTTVKIWIDGHNPHIDALQIIGQGDTLGTIYADDIYLHPKAQERETFAAGVFLTTFGVMCALLGLCWPLLKRLTRVTYRT